MSASPRTSLAIVAFAVCLAFGGYLIGLGTARANAETSAVTNAPPPPRDEVILQSDPGLIPLHDGTPVVRESGPVCLRLYKGSVTTIGVIALFECSRRRTR